MSKLIQAHLRHSSYYLGKLAEARALYERGSDDTAQGLKLFDVELQNIQAGYSRAAAYAEKNEAAAQMCIDYPNVAAAVLALRWHPQENLAWLILAMEVEGSSRPSEDRQGDS